MRTTQHKRLITLQAIRSFLDEHAERLPGVNASNARRRFDSLVDALHACSVDQEESRIGSLGETQRYHALRKALVNDHMAPVVAIARSVLVDDPALGVYSMPRGNPGPARLAAMATGLAAAVNPHKAVFIQAGLAEDFVDQLQNAAKAMTASCIERASRTSRRHLATAQIRFGLHAARTVVRVLAILVRKEAHGDVTLLTEWNAISAPRRIAATASIRALPAPAPAAALPRTRAKLLASGPASPEIPSSQERGTLAAFLEPLTRLLPLKRTA